MWKIGLRRVVVYKLQSGKYKIIWNGKGVDMGQWELLMDAKHKQDTWRKLSFQKITSKLFVGILLKISKYFRFSLWYMSCKLCFSCQAHMYLTVEYLHYGTTSAHEIIANESQKKSYCWPILKLWLNLYLNWKSFRKEYFYWGNTVWNVFIILFRVYLLLDVGVFFFIMYLYCFCHS